MCETDRQRWDEFPPEGRLPRPSRPTLTSPFVRSQPAPKIPPGAVSRQGDYLLRKRRGRKLLDRQKAERPRSSFPCPSNSCTSEPTGLATLTSIAPVGRWARNRSSAWFAFCRLRKQENLSRPEPSAHGRQTVAVRTSKNIYFFVHALGCIKHGGLLVRELS